MPDLTEQNRHARRFRVGASEVGALLDVHPYTSPARIFDRIVNDRGIEKTQVMRVGSLLEGPVAKTWAAIEGRRVRANRRTYLSPLTEWLAATPDYFVQREHAVLEVKLTGDRWDDLPPFVAWQVRAQLHATNRAFGYVVVANGSQLRTFELARDMAAEAAMIEAVDAFGREHLATHWPPPVVNGEARDVMLRVWTPNAGTITADLELEQYAAAMLEAQRSRRELAPFDEQARAGMVRRLVEADATAIVGNGWRATLEGDPPSRLVIRG